MDFASVLVSFFLQDFYNPPVLPKTQESVTVSSAAGDGELTATFAPVEMGGSVARGASRVSLGTLNLSASCDADITVQSISVSHVGLGETSDISAVYLVSGFRRVSRAARFDARSQRVTLRTPSMKIERCDAVRLDVLVDFSPDAVVASEHGISMESSSVIQSSAKNVTLQFEDTSTRVSTSPDRAGSVTVNFLPVQSRFQYGRIETIARLQITADAAHDQLLKSIVLTNNESARDMDFIDLRLETRRGEVLTNTAPRMKGKTVALQFTPSFVLDRNQTIVLLLKGQVHVSQYRKVDFMLEEPSDFNVKVYRSR